jgi:transaldolase
MNPLLELHDLGQSYWIDNLTREMLRNGRLQERVEKEGLRGVTSNPAIFHKAISSGTAYESQIRELFDQGMSPHEVYEEITSCDVRDACDVLRPIWERTDGAEGYVSYEVSPHLARDTEGSIREARHLNSKVNRPNLFIKIPGTVEGVPAIEQLLVEGVDVNVTLLFSVEAYERVAEAYLRALERRLDEGKPISRTTSVASFFLSRIDTLADKLLLGKIDGESEAAGGEPQPQDLIGKTAIASAKMAYQHFSRILASERWQRLAEHGAKPQRVLWASTSTKNPKYSDVKYVEPLIGPHTVNTMPDNTIEAFADHGTARANTIEEDVDEARWVLDNLRVFDIDLGEVDRQLEEEGIRKFIEPYDELIAFLESKR